MATVPPAWFAIIDGSRDPRLEGLVRSCREHICLFKGRDMAPELLQVAPWLVRIDERDALLSTWRQHGRGLSWGLMVCSSLSLDALRGHLRRFLQAKLPDGTIALFRFYDPRVFNTYIRAALPEEREPWFVGVREFAAETADGAALHQYRLESGSLIDGDRVLG